VRATEEGVQKRAASRAPRRRSAELGALEDLLRQSLMTKVRLVGTDRRGRIEILYASTDELDRLVGMITKRR